MIDIPARWELPADADLAKFAFPDIGRRQVQAMTEAAMTAMTAAGMKRCRDATLLGVVEYGQLLGYQGSPKTISRLIRSFEDGTKVPPLYIQRLVLMFFRFGIPQDFLPESVRSRGAIPPGLVK